MTRKTLYELITILQNQCLNHQSINTFIYGVADLMNAETQNPPYIVRVAPDVVSYQAGFTLFGLVLEVWGETLPDDSDRLIIESECESILNDIVSNFHRGILAGADWQFEADGTGNLPGVISAISVVHEKESRLTGFQVNLSIQGLNNYDFCTYPDEGI